MGETDVWNERAALLAMLDERPPLPGEHRRASWPEIALEVSLRGSALSLWAETHALTLDGMADPDFDLEETRHRLPVWANADFDVVTVLDANYPVALRGVHEMPPILFTKGTLRSDDVGVSIVGSRQASPRGRSMAGDIAKGLVERGLSVISGLADGIDTAAHQATLEAGGRPVGVIGTGINRVYPSTASSHALHEQVVGAGVLISQFLPGGPPSRTSFPMRNVTMSGLGKASIIVEAGERSGTRALARAAVEHGRAVILTDVVVNATQWGKQLANRPGVYVAGSTSEVMSIVESIVAEDVRFDIAFPPSAVMVRLPDIK
jgi:DNA protecting protein DprA